MTALPIIPPKAKQIIPNTNTMIFILGNLNLVTPKIRAITNPVNTKHAKTNTIILIIELLITKLTVATIPNIKLINPTNIGLGLNNCFITTLSISKYN